MEITQDSAVNIIFKASCLCYYTHSFMSRFWLKKKKKKTLFELYSTFNIKITDLHSITLVMLNKFATPFSSCQPIRLLDPSCWYKITYLMANSAAPDQLASSEANWSGSTMFVTSQLIWIYTVCKGRVYLGSAGLGLRPLLGSTKGCLISKILLYIMQREVHVLPS